MNVYTWKEHLALLHDQKKKNLLIAGNFPLYNFEKVVYFTPIK